MKLESTEIFYIVKVWIEANNEWHGLKTFVFKNDALDYLAYIKKDNSNKYGLFEKATTIREIQLTFK